MAFKPRNHWPRDLNEARNIKYRPGIKRYVVLFRGRVLYRHESLESCQHYIYGWNRSNAGQPVWAV